MNYQIKLSDEAEKDILFYRKSGNKSALRKIDIFFDEIRIDPYFGTGKPERLRYRDGNVWSRRIDSKNRLVYSIEENIVTVEIISAKGHYDDK
jgi:toxin YoeB